MVSWFIILRLRPGSGGTFARSAGASAQIVGKTDGFVTLKMPSGEIRMVLDACWATIGQLVMLSSKIFHGVKQGVLDT